MAFKRSHAAPDRPAAGASSVVGGREGPGRRDGNRRRVGRISVKLAATVVVLAVCALLASATTWSNLNATATNPSNSFLAGTVKIASNSGSSAVLSLTNAKPGAVSTGCIQVTYTGTLDATVRLYGAGGGSGLNQYLNLVVTRGTFSGSPSAGSCTGFSADSTNYIGQGAGVVYSGTVANWPSSSGSAQLDPTSSSPATWSTNSSHGYQFQVTLQSNSAGQGLNGTQTFSFEADNN